ncbi:hypothetical protein PVAND_003156 [Polypedilum vanderplanki]|uniref:Uncharacterized protein n=1 Tax=Polypedilum vanderplanki TaxID=319348 RepID=A0A9J6BT67_POLVA|nr:hypothetical protein PVAND_003156 [Polypedilum vanderplanki]
MNFTKQQIFTEFHNNSDFKQVSKKEAISAGLYFIQDQVDNSLTKEGQQKVSAMIKVLHNKFTKQISVADGKIEKLQQKSDWNSICLIIKNEWICEQDKKDREQAKLLAEECGNDIETILWLTKFAAEKNGNEKLSKIMDTIIAANENGTIQNLKIVKKK